MWLRLYLSLEEAGVEVVLANPKIKNRMQAILDKYEIEFEGTDMFGIGTWGMKWLRSMVSKLSVVDQFIFDAELRHIERLNPK